MRFILLGYSIILSSFLFSVQVTFIVDMTLTPASDDGVYVVGADDEFSGPIGHLMSDGDGDDVWELILNLPAGTYAYKFRNGFCDTWDECGTMFEDQLSGCGVGDWDDRELIVGSEDIIEGPYCFNTCEVEVCGDAPDTFPITFIVDMEITGSHDTGVYLVGGNNHLQGPLGILMNDDDEDEIWEVTVDLPPGTYTFKFRNGECDNWNSCPQEFWEDFEGECGVGEWGDREITVSNQGFTYGPYCFDFCQEGGCQADVDVDVTFQVQLTDEQMEMAANCDGVVVYGNFNNFDNWVNPYELEYAGDNIYTLDETFTSNDQLLYRYSICSGLDAIPETNEGVGGCGIDMGGDCSSGTNWREQVVPYVSGSFDLDYFDLCPGFARVIMSVDMSNEAVSGNGVCIAGGTMPNGPQGTQMCDIDDDGIYSATLSFPYNSHQTYKFINGCGDTWENPGFEELPSSCTEGQWNDRYFDVFEDYQLEGPHVFGECPEGWSDDGGDDGGNDEMYNVNFMLDGVEDCGFVSVTGSFSNWDGWGATTDNGMTLELEDGFYEFLILCVNTDGEWWNDIWGNSTIMYAPEDSECDAVPGDGYPNYGFTVNGSNLDISLCAGTCNSSCTDLSIDTLIPTEFRIGSAYPNPFNPTTTLSYTIPDYADISIDVYNLNGKLVENLYKGHKNPGEYSISWNASNVTSGVYFVRMTFGSFMETKKVILLK